MAETNEPHLCQQFVKNYLTDIQNQLDQCNVALTRQSQSCPKILSIVIIDHRLKEYVHSQQRQFSYKISHQLSQFKHEIREKQLHSELFAFHLTNAQVRKKLLESFYV